MRTLLCLCVLLAGCESFDPTGTYTGDANVGGQFQTILTRPDAQGRLNVNSSSSTQSRSGVTVTVRRVSERRLTLTLDDGCVVTVEQDLEPNEHNTTVAYDEEVTCPVQLDGYAGPIRIGGGTVSFGREDRTIDVTINGGPPIPADAEAPGSVSGSWSYGFRGTKPEE